MSTLQDSDLFIVDRNGTNYQLPNSQMSTLQDTDLFVVERSGVNYKIEAKDVSTGPTGSIGTPVAVLTPLNGAGTNAGQPYNPLSTALTAVGGSGDLVYATDTIASVVASPFDGSGNPANGSVTGSWDLVFNGSFGSDNTQGINTKTETTWTFDSAVSLGAGDTFEVYSSGASNYSNIFGWSYEGTPTSFTMVNGGGGIHGSGWGWDTLPITGDLKCLRIGSSPGFTVTGLRLNGVVLSAGLTTLTFPTDNNFDKFEVGDVVQAEGVTTQVPVDGSGNWVGVLGVVATDTSGPSFIFPSGGGDPNTDSGYFYWEGLSIGDKVRWYGNTNGTSNRQCYGDIEESTTGSSPGSSFTPIVLTVTATSGRAKIDFNGTATCYGITPGLAAIITAIDNSVPSITTDGGSWAGSDGTGSYIWSDYLTSQYTLSDAPQGFNGDTSNYVQDWDGVFNVTRNPPYRVEFIPPSSITYSSSVRVFSQVAPQAPYSGKLYVDTGSGYGEAIAAVQNNWTTIAAGSGSLVKFKIETEQNGSSFAAIEVDGVILLNAANNGATNVSKTVSSQATLTFTDDTELANMVGPLTQVDENGLVKTPVTSEIASVVSNVITVVTTLHQWNPDWTGTVGGTYAQRALQTSSSSLIENGGVKFTPGFPLKAGEVLSTYGATEGGSNGYLRVYFEDGTDDFMSGPLPNAEWNSTGAYQQISLAASDQDRVVIGVEPQNNPFSNGGNYNTGLESLRIDGQFIATTTFGEGQTLTFSTPNPDLQYFQPGDQVGTQSGFAAVAYTGNGGTQSNVCGFSPSLVWIKNRDDTTSHILSDTVRGEGKLLASEFTAGQYSELNAIFFQADGFATGSFDNVNFSGQKFIAWCWDAGDTTVTNNEGSLPSQVRSNGNFSVTKYTGNGSVADIGHGLNQSPAMVIVKSLDEEYWYVYHQGLDPNAPGTKYIRLNLPGEASTSSAMWNNTTATSSVFTVGPDAGTCGSNDFIAYAWAETPGISSFGKYSGNSSTTVVNCGFKPAFVLIKSTNNDVDWMLYDNQRGQEFLVPNTSQAEESAASKQIAFTSTGFSVTGSSDATNGVGGEFIYAAFAGSNPIEVIDVDVAANTMIVDGGDWHGSDDWNQSQVWSNYLSPSTASSSLAFDGSTTTEYNAGVNDASFYLNADTVISSLEIYGVWNSASTVTVSVGSTSESVATSGSKWYSFPGLNGATITSANKLLISRNIGLNFTAIKLNGKLLVNPSVTPTGETQVTGPPLIASADDVEFFDGNTLGVNGVSGTWREGLHAQGAEVTSTAPSPDSIQYTSANGVPLTTAFTGFDATLTTRTWTWQVSNAATGPWTDFATKVDTPGQDGALPLVDRPTLDENKFYQVKVKYDSDNAESVESTFNTFKTGTNS